MGGRLGKGTAKFGDDQAFDAWRRGPRSILKHRLKELEKDGLVASLPHPDSLWRKLYYLTPIGKDLIHVMVPLVRWAETPLADRLRIPEEKQRLLRDDPESMIEGTLRTL